MKNRYKELTREEEVEQLTAACNAMTAKVQKESLKLTQGQKRKLHEKAIAAFKTEEVIGHEL